MAGLSVGRDDPVGPDERGCGVVGPERVDDGQDGFDVGGHGHGCYRDDRHRVHGPMGGMAPWDLSGHHGPMASGCLPKIAPPSLALGLLILSLVMPGSALAAAEFPAGYEAYHTYAEVGADVAAVEAAHPDIVQRFSIGKSYLGPRSCGPPRSRTTSAVDEDEPEVLFDGGIHADEHMGVEMTLRILHWLADGYGTDPRITNIVDTREIWIIFMVNPDGVAVRHRGRQVPLLAQEPPADARARRRSGTDLNRNFGYRWGGGGRTSSNPRAITYRGTKAFSTPEARAFATSSRAGSSAAASRSGWRISSTRAAGW